MTVGGHQELAKVIRSLVELSILVGIKESLLVVWPQRAERHGGVAHHEGVKGQPLSPEGVADEEGVVLAGGAGLLLSPHTRGPVGGRDTPIGPVEGRRGCFPVGATLRGRGISSIHSGIVKSRRGTYYITSVKITRAVSPSRGRRGTSLGWASPEVASGGWGRGTWEPEPGILPGNPLTIHPGETEKCILAIILLLWLANSN